MHPFFWVLVVAIVEILLWWLAAEVRRWNKNRREVWRMSNEQYAAHVRAQAAARPSSISEVVDRERR
jgi:hypothetical protein